MSEGGRRGDADLVKRARAGDVRAFGRLVERHQDHIYNAVYHMVGDEQDAEDIAQDVFMKAYSHLNGFEGRARFSTWLYGIMLNTVRSHWRRAARRSTLSLGSAQENPRPDPPARGDGPARTAVRREQVDAVRAAIAGLDEEWREIIVLRDIRGLTYDELAETLQLPAGTVKSRLHRARQALKDRLAPLFGTAQP
jgi:RNA polymerase sigma-70 factor (ECF subfamily)